MADNDRSVDPAPRAYDDHSSACKDHNHFVGWEDDHIGECVCRPSANVKAPQTYELWWCEWCGEESCEGSDPCQRCGEPIVKVPMVIVAERDRYRRARDDAHAALRGVGGALELADGNTHKGMADACGQDACALCWLHSLAEEALRDA